MSDDSTLFLVQEIHNFGGFFGGDIITLTALRRPSPQAGDGRPDEQHTLTIDQRAFTNVRDRHTIAAGMLLGLVLSGERVERATLLGAASLAGLRAALGPPQPAAPLEGPLILSYQCDSCGLWVAGAPEDGRCRLCGQALDPLRPV
jgi:hypothetical protein